MNEKSPIQEKAAAIIQEAAGLIRGDTFSADRNELQTTRNRYDVAKYDKASIQDAQALVDRQKERLKSRSQVLSDAISHRPGYTPKGTITQSESLALNDLQQTIKLYHYYVVLRNRIKGGIPMAEYLKTGRTK